MKANRIKILLICSIILTLLSIVVIHYTLIKNQKQNEWVFHTYQVITKSDELLMLITDCETANRGYLITQDSAFLYPLIKADSEIAGNTLAMHSLINDNASQKQRFDISIHPLIKSKLRHLKSILQVNKEFGRDSAFKLVKAGTGKITMDSIRYQLKLFTDDEKKLLDARLFRVAQSNENEVVILYSSSLVIVLVSLLALFKIRQNQLINDRLLLELNSTNQFLESRVEDRTNELYEKNKITESLNAKLIKSLAEVQSFYDALQVKYEKAEDALNDIRDLYDNALCGYHSLGPDGIFLRMNNTELAWLGYTREEVIGKKRLTDLITPDDIAIFNDNYPKFREKGFVRNMRHNYVRKDGSSFPVIINATANYDDAGNYIMSRASVIDISEIKEMEEKLLAANKDLLNLNEEKNSLISVVAHDLKSPLSGILGLINIIGYHNENLTDDQREYITLMERSCQSMQAMIHNILDFNRIEKGLNTIYLEPVDVIDLTERILKPLKEQAAKKGISLTLQKNNEVIILKTDKSSYTRIIENLVSNALKFSSAQTDVSVRIAKYVSTIKVEIEDHGPGIRQEDMARLFGKYQTLSARPTGGESSSGLGLSIVKELVQALNGIVSVYSVEDKGSTFIVELPIN